MPSLRFNGADALYERLRHVTFLPRLETAEGAPCRGVSASGSVFNVRASVGGKQLYFGHCKDKRDAMRWADAVDRYFNGESRRGNYGVDVTRQDLQAEDVSNLLGRWEVLLQREGVLPKESAPDALLMRVAALEAKVAALEAGAGPFRPIVLPSPSPVSGSPAPIICSLFQNVTPH